jgi:hypothetical protein
MGGQPGRPSTLNHRSGDGGARPASKDLHCEQGRRRTYKQGNRSPRASPQNLYNRYILTHA